MYIMPSLVSFEIASFSGCSLHAFKRPSCDDETTKPAEDIHAAVPGLRTRQLAFSTTDAEGQLRTEHRYTLHYLYSFRWCSGSSAITPLI